MMIEGDAARKSAAPPVHRAAGAGRLANRPYGSPGPVVNGGAARKPDYRTISSAARISSAIILRLLFSMKKLGPACR